MDCQRCGGEIVRRRTGPEGYICERCYQREYLRRRAAARKCPAGGSRRRRRSGRRRPRSRSRVRFDRACGAQRDRTKTASRLAPVAARCPPGRVAARPEGAWTACCCSLPPAQPAWSDRLAPAAAGRWNWSIRLPTAACVAAVISMGGQPSAACVGSAGPSSLARRKAGPCAAPVTTGTSPDGSRAPAAAGAGRSTPGPTTAERSATPATASLRSPATAAGSLARLSPGRAGGSCAPAVTAIPDDRVEDAAESAGSPFGRTRTIQTSVRLATGQLWPCASAAARRALRVACSRVSPSVCAASPFRASMR